VRAVVLLDRSLNAKICDVGMSKLLQLDQAMPTAANPGTLAWSVSTPRTKQNGLVTLR